MLDLFDIRYDLTCIVQLDNLLLMVFEDLNRQVVEGAPPIPEEVVKEVRSQVERQAVHEKANDPICG